MSAEAAGEEGRKVVCEEVDKTLLDFFSTLTQLYQEKSRLHQAMKSGYLNLSRARYSMGVRNVGIQQCDENTMKASVKVMLDNDKFTIGEDIDQDAEAVDLKDGPTDSGLRHRKLASKSEEGFEIIDKIENIRLDDTKESDSGAKGCSKIHDPIKWFGILVPPALRQCQKDFSSTTDTVLSIANLQRKLETLQKKYTALMKQKNSMAT